MIILEFDSSSGSLMAPPTENCFELPDLEEPQAI